MQTATRQIPQLSESDKSRFFAKINKDGPTQSHMETPCWVWQAAKDRNGYGFFAINGLSFLSHRVSFVIHGGVFTPEKKNACHICDNPSCCNPSHVFVGSQADNIKDMYQKDRGPTGDRHNTRTKPETILRGERNGASKLTDEDVKAIRYKYAAGGVSQNHLAAEFGVDQALVSGIVNRKRWKHI